LAPPLLPDGEVEAVAESVRRRGQVVCPPGRPLLDAEQARHARSRRADGGTPSRAWRATAGDRAARALL